MELLPDVPTAKEEGFDAEIGLGRGVVAPGDFPDEAREAIIAALQKARESDDWKTFSDENAFQDFYIDGDELQAFLEKKRDIYHGFVREFGLAKDQQ